MRVRATRLFAISGGGRRGQSVFAGAAAAYSVRLPANSTYSGPLIRVRRSNDNAELNIGAVSTPDANGNRFIDTTALLAFTGANSGFVTTAYDVSGGGNHATQTTTANQPRIVNAGVVDTFNSRTAMFFDGTRWLVTAGIPALTTAPVTANGVFALTTTQTYRFVQSIGSAHATGAGWIIGAGGANNNFYAGSFGIANTSGTLLTANTGFVTTAVHTGSASSGFVNGTASAGTGNTFTYSVGTAPITIGSIAANGTLSTITGYVQEEVYFANTNISTTQRQALERNQGIAYGITVA